MGIRGTAFCIVVAALLFYTWKDWFGGLCGLILLAFFKGNPFFPERFANIQGMNLYNMAYANVLLAWLMHRRREGLRWDMPAHMNTLLLLWLAVLLFGWAWMMLDKGPLAAIPVKDLVSCQLLGPPKWPLLGLMLFDGCRTRHRVKIALVCILLLLTLFSIQIIRQVPASVVLYGDLDAREGITNRVGISINGAAKMMSGVPWAMLAILPIVQKRKYKVLILGASVAGACALALTGGRSGYAACVATGLFLCFLRWRRFLLLLPLMGIILGVAFPTARSTVFRGLGETDSISGEKTTNTSTLGAGREVIWPAVVSKILESPVFGYGREAMSRLDMTIINERGRIVPVHHAHQAYLEVLLESGLIGFVIIIGLHTVILVHSARLFVDRGDPLCTATGGLALALLTGHLVAYLGGQSFYPQVIDLGLWCAIGIMLRVYVARRHLDTEANGALAATYAWPMT